MLTMFSNIGCIPQGDPPASASLPLNGLLSSKYPSQLSLQIISFVACRFSLFLGFSDIALSSARTGLAARGMSAFLHTPYKRCDHCQERLLPLRAKRQAEEMDRQVQSQFLYSACPAGGLKSYCWNARWNLKCLDQAILDGTLLAMLLNMRWMLDMSSNSSAP